MLQNKYLKAYTPYRMYVKYLKSIPSYSALGIYLKFPQIYTNLYEMKQSFYCLDSLSSFPDTDSYCDLNDNILYISEPNNLILNYSSSSSSTSSVQQNNSMVLSKSLGLTNTFDVFISSILNPTTLSYCGIIQETSLYVKYEI